MYKEKMKSDVISIIQTIARNKEINKNLALENPA